MEHKILLVRHGESIQNNHTNDQFLPDHAIPLTDNGREQAVKAGEFLESYLGSGKINQVHTIWTSSYKRTRETAEGINSVLKLPQRIIKEDDMLVEMQFGLFHNLTKEECAEKFPYEWQRYMMERQYNGKFFARRPGGESPFDVTIRQKLFIDTLYRDINKLDKPSIFIIVGHGGSITSFRKAFFHYSYEWYAAAKNPGNCSIQLIRLSDTGNRDVGYIYGYAEKEN